MKPDDSETDPFVDALRGDLPCAADEARVRARLASLGLVAGGALTTKAALGAGLAGKGALTKTGLFADALARFGALSLGAKAGAATVAGALVAGGPIWIATSTESTLPASSGTQAPLSVTAPPRGPAQGPRATAAATATAIAAPRAIPQVEEPVPEASPLPEEPRVASKARPRAAQPLGAAPLAPKAAPSAVGSASTARAAAFEAAAPLGDSSGQTVAEDTGTHRAPLRTQLSEETALMDAAFSALRRGDRASAEGFVREHARRFPKGELRSERERAEALLGRAPAR